MTFFWNSNKIINNTKYIYVLSDSDKSKLKPTLTDKDMDNNLISTPLSFENSQRSQVKSISQLTVSKKIVKYDFDDSDASENEISSLKTKNDSKLTKKIDLWVKHENYIRKMHILNKELLFNFSL